MAESSSATKGRDDRPQTGVRLAWDQGKSKETLDHFLDKHPPSSTKGPAGGDGWIWVHSNRGDTGKHDTEVVGEGKKVVDDLMAKLKEIEENPKIPKVKSKKSGPSKKMVRESAVERCESQLRQLGKRHSSGKWMFFEKPEYVDRVFVKLARSIIDGPLSGLKKARCSTVKVAASDAVQREGTHLICLYLDDIWDKEGATEVLECVVKHHGEIPRSSKSDLYTLLGIDSNHPSKMRSALFRPSELFTMEQLKEWQQIFRNERSVKSRKISRTEDESDFASASRPVKADEFWPTTSTEDKKDSAALDEDTEAVQKKEAVSTTAKGDEVAEDSETEDEEEDLLAPGKTPRDKGGIASFPSPEASSSTKVASSSSPTKSSSAVAAPPSLEEKENKDEKPRDQIKVTINHNAVAGKKRDRFGRSDF